MQRSPVVSRVDVAKIAAALRVHRMTEALYNLDEPALIAHIRIELAQVN